MAQALARGLATAGVDADLCPLADGGEGTLDVLSTALGGTLQRAAATDPLGKAVNASFVLKDDLAIVETATASGLQLVPTAEPLHQVSTSMTIRARASGGALVELSRPSI